jgi:hypothetical protein
MAIVLDGTSGITTPDLTDTSLTSGRVVYAGASGNLTGASTFVFDGTNLGIGTSSPNTKIEAYTSSSGAQGLLTLQQADNSPGNSWGIDFRRTAGGGANSLRARIFAVREGGDATALAFSYTTSGGTLTQGAYLNSDGGFKTINTIGVGNATPSTSGAGITFPATQSASSDANTLDDYEEGTWTPTVTFGGASVGITYNTTFTGATYTKIGNRVCISGFLLLTNKGSSTGSARIANLPFTSESGNTKYLGATVGGSAFTFANQFWAFMDPNTNYINVHESTEAGASSSLTNSDFTNGTEFYFSVTYTV